MIGELTWDDLDLTRSEMVRGYSRLEKHQDRHSVEPSVERRHTILGGGLVEERVYSSGRLVEVRRFTLGASAPTWHTPQARRVSGRRLA